ncbi:LiaF transmembrane domain-containing protein [Taibaiella koreensis]|uniref:LiaF transmembrane domain-containing protein n=1 Tax=Taibaiella koreensis TaxID=1268548 RepID=UPI000E59C6D8|nr:DUF5668 domain-containing protein [Taibaiella koreensis]
MENEATKPYTRKRPEPNHKLGGLVLIVIGVLFLLNRIPQTAGLFPHWFFTWPMILIAIGIFTGVKNGFRHMSWLILVLIGCYFMLYENNLIALNLRPYVLPAGLILLGILVLIKRNRFHKHYDRCHGRRHPRGRFGGRHWEPVAGDDDQTNDISDDVISVSSTFGNMERNVFSKNFRGGNISSVFGGCQVNFTQADFQGTAVVDVSVMFGGVDIVIPANWNLKNELSVVFGGIEDRRMMSSTAHESGKTLILKGNVMFGGVEIKSF